MCCALYSLCLECPSPTLFHPCPIFICPVPTLPSLTPNISSEKPMLTTWPAKGPCYAFLRPLSAFTMLNRLGQSLLPLLNHQLPQGRGLYLVTCSPETSLSRCSSPMPGTQLAGAASRNEAASVLLLEHRSLDGPAPTGYVDELGTGTPNF